MNGYIKKEDAEQELQHFCDDMLHHFEMNLFAERARVKDCIAIIRKVPSVDVPSAEVVEVSKILKTADEQEKQGFIQTAKVLRELVEE